MTTSTNPASRAVNGGGVARDSRYGGRTATQWEKYTPVQQAQATGSRPTDAMALIYSAQGQECFWAVELDNVTSVEITFVRGVYRASKKEGAAPVLDKILDEETRTFTSGGGRFFFQFWAGDGVGAYVTALSGTPTGDEGVSLYYKPVTKQV